jgi:hypothetical protein
MELQMAVKWTDKIINWHMLPGSEVQRLVREWGKTDEQIAAEKGKAAKISAKKVKPTKTSSTPVVAAKPVPKVVKPAAPVAVVKPAKVTKPAATKPAPAKPATKPATTKPVAKAKKPVAKRKAVTTKAPNARQVTTANRVAALAMIPSLKATGMGKEDMAAEIMVKLSLTRAYAMSWIRVVEKAV